MARFTFEQAPASFTQNAGGSVANSFQVGMNLGRMKNEQAAQARKQRALSDIINTAKNEEEAVRMAAATGDTDVLNGVASFIAKTDAVNQMASERALSDILAGAVEIKQTPGVQQATAVDDEGNINPMVREPTTEARLSWDKAFAQLPTSDPRLRGKMALQLQKMRTDEETARLKALKELRSGGEFKHPADMEDASGNLYRTFISDGRQIVIDARGKMVDPEKVPGLKYTKGNVYLQTVDPRTMAPSYTPAPKAGGGRSPGLTPEAGKNVEQVGKMYKDMNVSEIDTFVSNIYPKVQEAKKTGQLPGVGYLANTNISNLLKSQEGEEIYRDVMGFASAILRASAGLSQTTQEAARVMTKMGFDKTASSKSFIQQFDKLSSAYERDRANIAASFGKQAVDMWMQNNPSGVDLMTPPWKKQSKKTVKWDEM